MNLRRAYWNLPTPALYEESIFRSEGSLSHLGPLVVDTGKHTARAAADKFVVREQSTEEKSGGAQYNRPFTGEKFSALLTRLQGYLQGRDVFVQDCYAGADPEYSLPDPHHHAKGLAQPVCAHHVPEDPESRCAAAARARNSP